jgi:hypothetical protein
MIAIKQCWGIKNMAENITGKTSGTSAQKLTRHEKSTKERWKRQADALRTNLKKRKTQIRQRSNPDQ